MDTNLPKVFKILLGENCIETSHISKTEDGFYLVNKSISDILLEKQIVDFPDETGEKRRCDRFFDDWFLYAVPDEEGYVYSLLKQREQEHDTKEGTPADGDTPGVTITFISFDCEILLNCLKTATDQSRKRLNDEINRVVASRGQRYHKALKKYFKNPHSQGAYLVAQTYIKTIAAYAQNGSLELPEHYKKLVQQSTSYKRSGKLARLPHFIEGLNRSANEVVCDNEKIYVKNCEKPTEYEAAAILATHTGNESVYSFAAEVEYHARFLTPLAKIKLPFFGKSIYDSAIRADMTVGDNEFEGPAPFYKADSKIVKRQYEIHKENASHEFDPSIKNSFK